jgi:ABC-type multidrug transport system permease subunit
MATIHQPRSSIYKMVDLLLLLSEGLQLYFGPAREAVEWFSSLGYPCPVQFNPADFFLDLVSVDYRSEEAENVSRRRIELLTGVFATDGAKKFAPSVEGSNQNLESNNNNSSNGGGTNAAAVGGSPTATGGEKKEKKQIGVAPSRFPNTPWTEFGLLLGRSWKQASRERPTQIITIAQSIVIGLVLAGLYSDIPKDATGIQDETGLLFFVTIFAAFGAMFASLTTFPAERGVVNRERSAKAYHVLPYYLARFICDIPLRVVQALLFGCIVYWIVGLNPSASAFFIFVALLFVEALASQGLGVAVSAVAPNEKMAFALAPALTVILILFGGFYVNADTIPVWLSWVKYLSHLFYAFMGLSVNNFKGRGGWSCTSTGEMQQEATAEEVTGCEITGDEILDRLGMSEYELWMAFVGLLGLLVFYNTLGYLFLRLTKPRYLPLAVEPTESGSVEKKKA